MVGQHLFSPACEAIDPLGFGYKIEDYLIELQLQSFPLALPTAIFMVAAEFSLCCTATGNMKVDSTTNRTVHGVYSP